MNFLADENVREPIISALRAAGHDVLSVAEESPGILDQEVLSRAQQTARILVTHDLGFGRLIFNQRVAPPPGIIQLRFPSHMRYARMADLVLAALEAGYPVIGHFVVIDERRVRFDPLLPSS